MLAKMLKSFYLCIFFCLMINTSITFGEHNLNNYDLARMTGNFVSSFHSTKQLKSFANSSNALFIPNEYDYDFLKNLNGTINSGQFSSLSLFENSQLKCVLDILHIFQDFPGKDQWSLKMLDSFGKFESGMLAGNFKSLGNYQECLNVYAPAKGNASVGNFHGQYCTVQVTVQVQKIKLPFVLGICLPDSCDMNNPVVNIPDFLNIQDSPIFQGSFVNVSHPSCQPNTRKLTSAAIGMIVFLSLLVLLSVIGSFLTVFGYFSKLKETPHICFDGIETINEASEKISRRGSISEEVLIRDRSEQSLSTARFNSIQSFFNCFCVFTNGEKLLNVSNTEGQMLSLHGIRFLSMCWVMVCHAYAFEFAYINNTAEVPDLVGGWSFQIILNGFYSVDSFFLLSGFLLAYLFFKEASKNNGKVPWAYFYVHRYLRLTPVYMIVLGFYTSLFYYLGDGPMWAFPEVDSNCQSYWWYNILYINNFISMSKQCIGWSWYLANDMQFFVISPLFLITLYRWPKVGMSLLALFLCGTFAANFGITYHYNLMPGIGNIKGIVDMQDFQNRWGIYFDKLYIRPYTRIGPYLVGLILGYYLVKRKESNAGKDNKIFLTLGWLVSIYLSLVCLFGLYDRDMGVVESSFYNASNRICFGVGLGWVIYTCLTGQAGIVDGILSFKLFIPLSRLTYCAYLVHPIVMSVYYGSVRDTFNFSHLVTVFTFFGFIIVTYVTAFVTSILFESPIIRLEKLVRKKFSRQS